MVLKLYNFGLYVSMKFEFDPAKSAANKDKHGLDFVEAQKLWTDPALMTAPARTEGEPRSIAIAFMDGAYWSAIFTLRGANIRLISVRRSRQEEIENYEN